MMFKQFYLESLGHASYLIGSEETGEALVLDPRRDVDVYFQNARQEGVLIAFAVDTHQHNDYLSGARELSHRGGVEILASASAQLGYPARPLKEGERLEIGEIFLEVLQTPGHTPEHINLLVRDRSLGEEPVLLLSGGSLLVGDVARPDLLGGAEATREAACSLCHTLQTKIHPLPDHLMVFPTHVSGSLCGGSIGEMLFTTVGYERRMNRLLKRLSDEKEFVSDCLDLKDLPTVPPYWRRMRRQNQQGPALLGGLKEPATFQPSNFDCNAQEGGVILDCRAPEAFGGGHIPGALNVGIGSAFRLGPGRFCRRGQRSCSSWKARRISGRSAGSCCESVIIFRSGGLPGGCPAGGRRENRSRFFRSGLCGS